MNITTNEWESKLKETKIDKTILNQLVGDYLLTEGYSEASKIFEEETNISLSISEDISNIREEIRSEIFKGDIPKAIELLNNYNPEILDNNPTLMFILKRQQFIEILRNGDMENALLFSENELAPRTLENESIINELETVMSLFAFDTNSIKDSPVSNLMDPNYRQITANKVNEAILKSIYQERESKLLTILRFMLNSQEKLGEKIDFPHIDFSGNLTSIGKNNEK